MFVLRRYFSMLAPISRMAFRKVYNLKASMNGIKTIFLSLLKKKMYDGTYSLSVQNITTVFTFKREHKSYFSLFTCFYLYAHPAYNVQENSFD